MSMSWPQIQGPFRRLVCLIFGAASFLAPALAYGEGGPFHVDLDGDGRIEVVESVKIATTDAAGDFYKVIVNDENGSPLWRSPGGQDIDNPFTFGRWHFGICLPQIVWDIDADGEVEMVVPDPQSDVSPPVFRVFRWGPSGFTLARKSRLERNDSEANGFEWRNSAADPAAWIARFHPQLEAGQLSVDIVEVVENGMDVRTRSARLSPNATGFTVSVWGQSEDEGGGNSSKAPDLQAQSPKEDAYRARLGHHDHHNSQGVLLTRVIEILRQDRANYHKFNRRDPEDTTDPWFREAEGRVSMDGMAATCSQMIDWEGAVLQAYPLVEVRRTLSGLEITIVEEAVH